MTTATAVDVGQRAGANTRHKTHLRRSVRRT
jgi:hypothetical protein